MSDETSNLINYLYEKETFHNQKSTDNQRLRKSPKAKFHIFDEVEFTRGRQVLGELIVHGMVASGGTDIDWLIEHNGGFIILEFKGFHNDKINIPRGQMIAYEQLYEKLNLTTKCYLYIVGCDEIDFTNPDATIWIFDMNQWKNEIIPKITKRTNNEKWSNNRYFVYREFMEEVSVDTLRIMIDSHWKEFECLAFKNEC